MPSAVLDATIAEMKEAETVMDGAVVFITNVPVLVQAAVDKALANGATAAELEPLTALNTEFKSKSDALQAAIVANTPQA